jgi:hypothetical protein
MSERYLALVDGDPVLTHEDEPATFDRPAQAIVECELELARREVRAPRALPWLPTPYGWVTSNGRAKVVRKVVADAA